jgi:hypothetical protein
MSNQRWPTDVTAPGPTQQAGPPSPSDEALARLAVTLVSWRDAGANAPVEPVVRDIVNLLRGTPEDRLETLRRSGWVELLWGVRADLAHILANEVVSRPTFLALTARIQEIGAALAAVKPE